MMAGGYAEDSDPRFVYTFWTADDRCLYVGCTVDFVRRLRSHRLEREWWSEVARFDVTVHPDRATGVAAETERIKALDPMHNRVYTSHATVREWTPARRARHSEAVKQGKRFAPILRAAAAERGAS